MCDKKSLRSACAYVQSDQSLCESLEYYMSVKLLPNIIRSLKGGCIDSFESTLFKIPHCWKTHVTAHMSLFGASRLQHCERGSYMSNHVLLNLLNELGKRDKMRGLPSVSSLFRNEFKKFNNTRARILDSFYH